MPTNRICPSRKANIWTNIRRHRSGEENGSNPSTISTKASASQIVSLVKIYFFLFAAGAVDVADPTPPRNTLKNSEDAGSSTTTSLLLLNAAL